jgi:4-oxalocrotonate tautomerase
MPHVIVKLYAGRSDAEKARLAEALARTVIETLGSSEASLSVAVEDVAPADWPEQVYRADILDKPDSLYRKPGYDPFR